MLTRRSALTTAAAFAITPGATIASEGTSPVCTWPAVRARFVAVARAFRLSAAGTAAALADGEVMIDTLIELFKQHGVSMTWVITGTGEPLHWRKAA